MIDTPALVIDLEVMESNIARMSARTAAAGVQLSPHTKTHKSPWIARLQKEAGASSLTCAKLGEAEVLADAGVTDLLIAYPLVGDMKLRRLQALLERGVRVRTVADHVDTARGLAQVGQALGRPVELLLEVNTGQDRCGLLPGAQTVALGLQLKDVPGLKVTGLMTHGGHVYAADSAQQLRELVRQEALALQTTAGLMAEAGIPVTGISVGSTPGSRFLAEWQGVTEVRPGTYVFNDMVTVKHGAAALSDCALSVLATVVSRPAPDRAVVDAGSKSLALDLCPGRPGHGYVRELPGSTVARLSEEHGVVLLGPGEHPAVGERVRLIPNHVCPVVNLFDRAYGVRNGMVEREIEISARGRVQ